jgi:hypothetical protein
MIRNAPVRIRSVWCLALLAYCIAVVGCGGKSSTSSSVTPPPPPPPPPPKVITIARVAPSKIMIGAKTRFDFVYVDSKKEPFDADAVVLIDGAAVETLWSEYHLQVRATIFDQTVPGIHTIEVYAGGVKSNALTVECYVPKQGPQPFNAVNSYYLEMGAQPYSVAVADFDGDSIGDVIVLANNSIPREQLIFLKGKPDSTLSPAQIMEVTGVDRMTSGDINGDGFVDLVLTSILSYETRIMTNDGHGNFTQTSQEIYQGIDERKILLEDMNGDGRLDLVTLPVHSLCLYLTLNEGRQFGVPVFMGNPSRSLPLESQSFSVADFNGDGRKDVMYTSYNSDLSRHEIRFLLQKPDGGFEDVLPDLPGLPDFTQGITEKATVVDFDKNGLPDLLVQIKDSSASITLNAYKNLGNSSFAMVSSSQIASTADATVYQMVSGDFDNDGYQDLAGINGEAHVLYLWGGAGGTYVPARILGPNGLNVTAGDVNGDGVADAVIGDVSTNISVVYGGERDIPQPAVLSPNNSGYLSAADINRDGFLDIMVSGYFKGVAGAIYLNDGKGNFTLGATVFPQGIMIADLDRDGKAELIGAEGAILKIWPGEGNPEFPATPVLVTLPNEPGRMQVLDMNLDGILDIVTEGRVLYGRGNYSYDLDPLGFDPSYMVVGDSDGDGYPDIVSNSSTHFGSGDGLQYYYNYNGLGDTGGGDWISGDFNRDGIIDVVISELRIFYGRITEISYSGELLTTGVYYDQGHLYGLEDVGASAVADFNGDGFPDIVMGSQLYNYSVLFTNDGNGGFQRSYFAPGVKAGQYLCADFDNDSLPDIAISGTDSTVVLLKRDPSKYAAIAVQKLSSSKQFQNKPSRKPLKKTVLSQPQIKKPQVQVLPKAPPTSNRTPVTREISRRSKT